CHDAQPHLDGVHTVFGQASNVDVVLAIRKGTRITKVTILP
ncbi:MAG: peptidylprolyl isomerase, partial [Prochlorococcaceae cyanobacterium]